MGFALRAFEKKMFYVVKFFSVAFAKFTGSESERAQVSVKVPMTGKDLRYVGVSR